MLRKIARLMLPIMLLTMLLAEPIAASADSVKITAVNSMVSYTTVGNSAMWSPVVTGGSGTYQYRYTLYRNSTTGVPEALQGWSSTPYYSYSFTKTGTYYLVVGVRDAANTSLMAQATSSAVTVTGNGPKIGFVNASTYMAQVGTGVTWTVYNLDSAVGVTGADGPVTYTYMVLKDGSLVNTFTRTSYIFNYTPTAPGDYEVRVLAADKNGDSGWMSAPLVSVTSNAPVVSAVNPSVSVVQQGESVTFSASVTGGYGTKTYYWALYGNGGLVKTATTTTPSWKVELTNVGPHMAQCQVVDSVGSKSNVGSSGNVVVQTPTSFEVKSVKPTKAKVGINTTATWKVTIQGGIGTKTVNYIIYKDGQAVTTSSGTTTGTSYTITHWVSGTGAYTVDVTVKDANNNYAKTVASDTMLAVDPTALTISSLTVSPNKLQNPGKVTWKWVIENNKGGVNTYYTIRNNGNVVHSGYTTGRIVEYKVVAYGVYTIEIYAIDVVTHQQTAPITGGQVVYGATGPVTITSPSAVSSTYVAPANIQWVWNTDNTVGTVKTYYQVNKDGNKYTVASTTASNVSIYVTDPGVYTIQVEAVDGSGRHSTLQYGDPITVTAAPSTVSVASITADKSTATVNDTITWTYNVKNGSGAVTGYYAIRVDGAQIDSGSCAPGTYSFSKVANVPGTYTVQVQVVDKNGTSKMVEGGKVVVTPVAGGSLSLTGLAPSTTSTTTNTTVTWTYSVAGASGPYRVYYLLWRNGAVAGTGSVAGDAITIPMTQEGVYDIQVEALDINTSEKTGAIKCGSPVTVTASAAPGPGTFTLSQVAPASTNLTTGQIAVWKINYTNNEGNVHIYYDVLFNGGVVHHNATYNNTISYPVTNAGSYNLRVQALDEANGNKTNTEISATVTVKDLVEFKSSSTLGLMEATEVDPAIAEALTLEAAVVEAEIPAEAAEETAETPAEEATVTEEAPAEEPAAEEVPAEETVTEEAPVEEAAPAEAEAVPAEEATEEFGVEEPAEEATEPVEVVEEAPAEEADAVEAAPEAVEETVVEETVVEETVAEPAEEVVEETVIETVEPAEETVEETAAETEPEAVEEPAEAPAEEAAEETAEAVIEAPAEEAAEAEVQEPKLRSTVKIVSNSVEIGGTIVWKVGYANNKGSVRVKYEVLRNDEVIYQSSTYETTITFEPQVEGEYTLKIFCFDEGDSNYSDGAVESIIVFVTVPAPVPAEEIVE